MGKLFLFMLVVLGAALYFPDSRARLVSRVEPLIEPALAPIRLRETKSELKKIAQDLQGYERFYDKVPTNDDMFRNWLYNQYLAPSNYQDSWGREFGYRVWPDSFAIVSAGPDQNFMTADDMMVATRRNRPGRR
ncbi:MAG: hypothetical protein ACR2QM_03435 [Longimicrobiales bacterium]